jgi:RNA methyltransferase, TrmH family
VKYIPLKAVVSPEIFKTKIMPGPTFLKFVSSLKQKKYRQKYRLFVIEGEKAVDELMASGYGIHSVFAVREWIEKRRLKEGTLWAAPAGSHTGEFSGGLFEVSDSGLRKISSMKTPNKVLAVVHMPDFRLDPASLTNSLSLVLDNIQDPGNLGTLVRSADWFGIENIILSENSAEVTNPKVIQATMGSVLRVRTHYTDLPSFLGLPVISEIPVFGAFAGAPPVYSVPLAGSGMIVLGNESQGISDRVKKYIKQRIGIPVFPRKGILPESLNMAVAGSLIISEFRRRMHYPHSK